MARLVVSMTTTPWRIDKIWHIVMSILNQTRKPDEFLLFVPEKCKRGGESYQIPEWLSELSDSSLNPLKVVRVDEDLGPATKLLPALKRVTDDDTRIVTFDDDVIVDP